jgi:hypothetical protein
VIVKSSVVDSTLSLAVSLSTYVPSIEKLAVVLSALASPNVTVPGPLTFDHVVVNVAGGLGNPSSLAVPLRSALAGSVIVWSAPAFTTGSWLIGVPPPPDKRVAAWRVTLPNELKLAATVHLTTNCCPADAARKLIV